MAGLLTFIKVGVEMCLQADNYCVFYTAPSKSYHQTIIKMCIFIDELLFPLSATKISRILGLLVTFFLKCGHNCKSINYY